MPSDVSLTAIFLLYFENGKMKFCPSAIYHNNIRMLFRMLLEVTTVNEFPHGLRTTVIQSLVKKIDGLSNCHLNCNQL